MGKMAKKSVASRAGPKSYAKIVEENKSILLKNKELVESLAECKMSYEYMLEQRSKLQRENLELIVQNRELNNRLSKINTMSRNHLDMAIKCSDLISNVIYQSCNENNVSESSHSGNFNSNDDLTLRTKAVKPMVSGHVIHRPTIKLPRVPTEELVRLGSSSRLVATMAIANNDPNSGESSSSSSSANINSRLSTLNEVEEESAAISSPRSNNSNKSVPLLSGIFNDVRVYLSPMDRVFPALANNRPMPSTSQETQPVNQRRRNKRPSEVALVDPLAVRMIKLDPTPSSANVQNRVTRSSRGRTH